MKVEYKLDIVIPCFQEEQVLPLTIPIIASKLREEVATRIGRMVGFSLILIDDGSTDSTWQIIQELRLNFPEVIGLRLSRNYGHQAAMMSGLTASTGDVIISMDADLQDDIAAVGEMLDAYESGCDMALGVRSDRSEDSTGKRFSAQLFYKLLATMGVETIPDHADYRLMSRRALNALLQYTETNLYLRGLIPQLGFKTMLIPYARKKRAAGQTKYTMSKMIGLALDGITSFSVVPLRMIAILGALVFFASALTAAWYLGQRLFAPSTTVPGWASTVLPLFALGGVQILSLAVIGEYVGKIYVETKRRPRFIIERTTKDDVNE